MKRPVKTHVGNEHNINNEWPQALHTEGKSSADMSLIYMFVLEFWTQYVEFFTKVEYVPAVAVVLQYFPCIRILSLTVSVLCYFLSVYVRVGRRDSS